MPSRSELIGAVLQHAARLGRELTAGGRPFGGHRLSRNQLDALFILAHSAVPVTAGDLAHSLAVTPGAVTQLVGGLRDLGLVETVIPEVDARVRMIRLTARARTQVEFFEQEQVTRLAARFDALDDAELAQLSGLLSKERDRV